MSISSGIIGDAQTLVADFGQAWSDRFGDAQKDIVALADVAAVLSDIGVPDAGLAATVLSLFGALAGLKASAAPDDPYWSRPWPQYAGR